MENTEQLYNASKIIGIFDLDETEHNIYKYEKEELVPRAILKKKGAVTSKFWPASLLPEIGEKYGFLKKFDAPKVISVYTRKGGVLKTTTTLNLARMYALNGLKVLVIGLDEQEDISCNFGDTPDIKDSDSLDVAMSKIVELPGLYEIFKGKPILECIGSTDLPTLFYIPENDLLSDLDIELNSQVRREFWLKEKVINKAKEVFDLIIIDCCPQWSILTQNAIAASDAIVSPLECKINNYRNHKKSIRRVDSFCNNLMISPKRIHVPTRLNARSKLGRDIRSAYVKKVKGCTVGAIKELIDGEKSMSQDLSFIEYDYKSKLSNEFKDLLIEIDSMIRD